MTVQESINTLGRKATDKITGLKGVITSISFDLYGCVQAILTPPGKDGKLPGGCWFDLHRLKISPGKRVMDLPTLDFQKDKGPAEKPSK